ncbi:uncharacterized protein [Diadema setosum]|uniref:uncharacterized protein n=1 Tax=Diadema setosum TaxID=31175 RepID=UPI003B3A0984
MIKWIEEMDNSNSETAMSVTSQVSTSSPLQSSPASSSAQSPGITPRRNEDDIKKVLMTLIKGVLDLPRNATPASTVCQLQLKFRHYDKTIHDLNEKVQVHSTLLEAVREITHAPRGSDVNDVIKRLQVFLRRQEKWKTCMKRRLENAEEQVRCSQTLVKKLEDKIGQSGEKQTQLRCHLETMQDKIASVSACSDEKHFSDVEENVTLRKQYVELKRKYDGLEKELIRVKASKSEFMSNPRDGSHCTHVETSVNRPSGEMITRSDHSPVIRTVPPLVENSTQTDIVQSQGDSARDHEIFKQRTKEELCRLRFENNDNQEMVSRLRKLLSSFHKSLVINNGCVQMSTVSSVDQAVLAMFSKTQIARLEPSSLEPWQSAGTEADTDELVIGRGAFARVSLMHYVPSGLPVAVKIQDRKSQRSLLSDDEQTNKIMTRSLKETVMHYVMSGFASFPAMHGVVQLEENLGMVLEFIGDKSTGKTYPLCDVLAWNRPRLTQLEWIDIALDVVNGIVALHEKGLLHNDLKSNNILLQECSDRWRAFIIDFGHGSTVVMPLRLPAFSLREEEEYCQGLLYQHLAPEIARNQQATSVHSDVYSLGIVLRDIARVAADHDIKVVAEMCTRARPYRRPSMPNIALSIARCKEKAQLARQSRRQ